MRLLSRRSAIVSSLALTFAARAPSSRADAPPAPGPRKRILVSTFLTVTSFDVAFGGQEAGAAMAAQLATLLEQSGDFDVVERSSLDSILKEQGLLATAGNVAQAAQHAAELLGAQIIVQGFVSTFSASAKTSGFSIGFGNPDYDRSNGSVGTNATQGVIGIELKLIDPTTAKLVGATHLEDTFHTKSNSLNLTGAVSATQAKADNPVLGVVTRGVLTKAVAFISNALRTLPWAGHVVDVDADQVFINVGGQSGVKLGDIFTISRVSRRIVDPESGELLGIVESPLGQVRITSVQDKFSIGQKDGAFDTQKGDLARYGGAS